jgi:hypothetical protein
MALTPINQAEFITLLKDCYDRHNAGDENVKLDCRFREFTFDLVMSDCVAQATGQEIKSGDFFKVPFKLIFSKCSFMEFTNFNGATFEKDIQFLGTSFKSDTMFMKTVFKSKADFSFAEFVKDVRFSSSLFKEEVSFTKARFNGTANFSQTTFKRNAQFAYVVFYNDADFTVSIVEQQISFISSIFRQGGTFVGCTFGEQSQLIFGKVVVSSEPLYFDTVANVKFSANYLNPNIIQLVGCDLTHLNVTEGNGLTGFSFDNCTWPTQRLGLWKWWGLLATFKALPKGLHKPLEKKPEEGKMVYARLKEQAKESGQAQLASDFYFWQMWFSLQTVPGWKRFFDLKQYYYMASHFGLSITLPLLWFVAWGLGFSWVYGGLETWPIPQGFGGLANFWQSMNLSLPTDFFVKDSFESTWPLVKVRHPQLSSVLLTLQLLIQGFFVFEMASAIRNKVKR